MIVMIISDLNEEGKKVPMSTSTGPKPKNYKKTMLRISNRIAVFDQIHCCNQKKEKRSKSNSFRVI